MQKKASKTPSGPPSTAQATEQLVSTGTIGPFRIMDSAVALRDPSGRAQLDARLTLGWGETTQSFAVEYKSAGTPMQLTAAIAQARALSKVWTDLRPMVVVPYLSEAAIERLLGEEVSGVDLCGNYAITVPNRWLVVRNDAPNRYPDSGPIKNVFRGKSSLVPRALMIREEVRSATALQEMLREYGQISLPTISKVLKTLEEELLIERGERIRVIQADQLLRRLRENYRTPEIRRRIIGKIGVTPALLSGMNDNAASGKLLYAASGQTTFAVLPSSQPLVRIYTQDIKTLLGDCTIEETNRFPDVELLETDDFTVFADRRLLNGYFVTSPLQVYLELVSGEKREKQAAEPIESRLLTFGYGPA